MEDLKAKILSFFKDLKFEEDRHRYTVKGKRLKKSVSGIVKNFVRKVDFVQLAKNKDIRENLPIGTTKKQWDTKAQISCNIGNKVHAFGEVYAFNRNIKPSTGYEQAMVNFWDSMPDHIVPVITELEMYHKEYMFGGTKDLLLLNLKTNKFIPGDYKTNEDLFKNYKGKTLRPPFNYLLDNPINKYQIQLSLYQIMFEQTGFEVERRILIWLKPDGTFVMYDTEDLTNVLIEYLDKKYKRC